MLVIAVIAAAMGLLMYAVRPRQATASLRLCVVRAAVIIGAVAILCVEILSAIGQLTTTAINVVWPLLLVAAAIAAWWRRRRDGATGSLGAGVATHLARLRQRMAGVWSGSGRIERVGIVALLAMAVAELAVALAAEPNNYDSQTYHLPKIEHWAQQGSVEFFATRIHRQVTLAPGAEYLLTHLRLSSGSDDYYNILQWTAAVGCVLIATRLCAQLGGGRRAQLITAVMIAFTPMVVLQATSTQVDLVMAAWTGSVATVAMDGLRRRGDWPQILTLGAATGLVAITKTSGLLGVGPILLLWGLAQLRLAWLGRHGGRTSSLARPVLATVVIVGLAALLVGPYLARMVNDFGHPLGPEEVRNSIPMQRHDPASVAVNALRIGQTALDTPIPGLSAATADAIGAVADLLGVDVQDRDITFHSASFPERAWHPDEDKVSFPITGVLALIAVALSLIRPGSVSADRRGLLRCYAAAVTVTVLLYTATVKWQPWGNRLIVFALVLAVPLAGVWLESWLRRRRERPPVWRRRLVNAVVLSMLSALVLSGVLAVSYGMPRRLVGEGDTFTTSQWDTRFIRRPEWKDDYLWAANAIDESGARRVGLAQSYDSWEYPWWVLLPGRHIEALQSNVPLREPAEPADVDAVLCTLSEAKCLELLPDDWQLHYGEHLGYALPPR